MVLPLSLIICTPHSCTHRVTHPSCYPPIIIIIVPPHHYYTVLSIIFSYRSDPELTSGPTTPSSIYTDAEEEEPLVSALEEGDFDIALHLFPVGITAPLRVGQEQLTPLHYACQHGRLDIVDKLVQLYNYDLKHLDSVTPTPLQIASASGHLNVIDYLLENMKDISFKPGHVNPFHLAADNGLVSVMKRLLDFSPSLLSMVDHDGNSPLHHACAHGSLSVVTFLCNEVKHPLVVRNKKGETLLHMAMKNCHFDVIRFLIDEKGCDPLIKDTIGCTPLHLAAKSGCLDIIQYLNTEKNCNFEYKTSHSRKGKLKHIISGRTALHYASYGGHCDIVTYLIEESLCNPCCVDNQGFTALHLACQEGHSEVVRFLLSLKEVDPNDMATRDGITPIHAASLSGNLEIIKLLVDQYDGDISQIDSGGRTALHYSSRKGHTDIVQYMIQDKGMDSNSVDQSHMTPLHLASQHGHLGTVKYLITDALANSNETEENGYTALHLAANKGHLPIVKFLVGEKHTGFMVRDKAGRTPLHHSCQSGHLDVVKYLTGQPDSDSSCQEKSLKASPLHLAAGFGHLDIVVHLTDEKNCSPTCTDKFNSTPIHRAAASGHCDIMNFFIKEKQCNSVLKNKFGNTPLHLACQKGQAKMIELLLSFSKENMTARNQVGRIPLDLTDDIKILSIFLKNGIDPSKGTMSSKYPYLKFWEPLNSAVKLFLLGDIDTGKSTLAKNLQGGGFFQEWMTGRFQRERTHDSETSGIIPIFFESKHFGRVVLYDFAGHPSYHASHSVIINVAARSSSPIFLVCVDLRKSPDLIEKSFAYWTNIILTILDDPELQPHLILIGTHEDELSKDGLRHKPAVLEKLAAFDIERNIKFGSWVAVDCRKPNSTNMHRLRQFISQRCDAVQSAVQLDYRSCLLRSFMLHKFQGATVVELSELLEYIAHANIPDIKAKDILLQACQSLHSRGYLLLLEDKNDMEMSWIIHNQETILSMVHGFHKLVEIPIPLGLVSMSQMQTSLGSMGFNMSLAIRYLLRMEFCIKLADRKILYSISEFNPPHPPEDHLFFPHLIKSSAPPDIWQSNGAQGVKEFGWFMKCDKAHQILGPRFLQLLLIRIASQFPFNTNPNFPFSAKRGSCMIWRKGLSWKDSKGIEALIEVQKQGSAVIFLSRIKENSIDFYHFRSSVIRAIRKVKKESCSQIKVTENVIHPDCLKNYHVSLDTDAGSSLSLFRVPDIYAALMNPELIDGEVTAEQVLLDDDPVKISVNTSMHLQDLLVFDSYMGLPNSVLTTLFSSQTDRNCPITEEDHGNIADTLAKVKWDLNYLLIILRSPLSGSRTENLTIPVTTYRAVFQRWAERNGELKTYMDLWNLFSQYSIFSEDNYNSALN